MIGKTLFAKNAKQEKRPHGMAVLQEGYNKKMTIPDAKPGDGYNGNLILSETVRLGFNSTFTRRNTNVLVIGSSGTGTSRCFVEPNILERNTNMIVTDVNGYYYRQYGKYLENSGYTVKLLDFENPEESCHYNPFMNLEEERDAYRLADVIIDHTQKECASDDYYYKAEKALLVASIIYLWHTAPPEDQTFTNITKLIGLADIDKNDTSDKSTLDQMFEDFEKNMPSSLAMQEYKIFKDTTAATTVTVKTVIISLSVRLSIFELSAVKQVMSGDDLELRTFADSKQALFVKTSPANSTYGIFYAMLIEQAYSILSYYAEMRAEYGYKVVTEKGETVAVVQADNRNDSENARQKAEKIAEDIRDGAYAHYDAKRELYLVYTNNGNELVGWRGDKKAAHDYLIELSTVSVEYCGRECPEQVSFILDEIQCLGTIGYLDDATLSTMRKLKISMYIICQSVSQLKAVFKKRTAENWRVVVNNCDTKLFLGSCDFETIKWISGTIGTKTEKVSYSNSAVLDSSKQKILPEEQITTMDNDKCIVLIKGVQPYIGYKYRLEDHQEYEAAVKAAHLKDDNRFIRK